nr:MAG TPA: Atrial natriuretic peptide [Caudoviricetes sp.]
MCFGQKPDRMNVTIKDAAAVGAVRAASAKGGMPYG